MRVLTNDLTRVWLAVPGNSLMYMPGMGVDWVEQYKDGSGRVALRIMFPDSLLQYVHIDTVQILHGRCKDPSVYENGKLLAEMSRLTLETTTIEKPVAVLKEDIKRVELVLVFTCKEVKI